MTSNLFDVAKALYPETFVVAGSSAKCFTTVLSAHKETDSYYWDSEVGSLSLWFNASDWLLCSFER
jgi:hypothetical protein